MLLNDLTPACGPWFFSFSLTPFLGCPHKHGTPWPREHDRYQRALSVPPSSLCFSVLYWLSVNERHVIWLFMSSTGRGVRCGSTVLIYCSFMACCFCKEAKKYTEYLLFLLWSPCRNKRLLLCLLLVTQKFSLCITNHICGNCGSACGDCLSCAVTKKMEPALGSKGTKGWCVVNKSLLCSQSWLVDRKRPTALSILTL